MDIYTDQFGKIASNPIKREELAGKTNFEGVNFL